MRHHGQDPDRLTVVGFDEISWLRGNSPAWRLLRISGQLLRGGARRLRSRPNLELARQTAS